MIHFREVAPPEGKQSYMMIDFDHSKIKTAGRKAIGHFLQVNFSLIQLLKILYLTFYRNYKFISQ